MCGYLLESPADVSASYLAKVTEFVPQKHVVGAPWAQVRRKKCENGACVNPL